MNKELEKKIKAVEGKGLKRILVVFKLCVHEMDRLVDEIKTNNRERQTKALAEAKALMQAIDKQISDACKNDGMKLEEFNAALNNPSYLTPEERKQLTILPVLIRTYPHLIPRTAKRRKKRPSKHRRV